MVQSVPVSPLSIGTVLVMALLVSVFGNLCWNAGNRMIGPARASIFINLIPVFGTVLAITLLDEALQGYHLIGGGLVVLGLILAAGVGTRIQGIIPQPAVPPREPMQSFSHPDRG